MAPQIRSAGSIASSAGRRQKKRTTSTPRNEIAFTRKVTAGPAAATTSPARAGPRARAMLKPMLPRVTAAGRSSRGTMSGTLACQAGPLRAAPRPRRKVKARRSPGVVAWAAVNAHRPKAARVIQVWVTRSRRRRSSTSATAPAGSESRNIGRLVAACTSATRAGDGLSVVIIHDAPTFWNQVPMFDATLAIHSQRKIVCRNGLQVERGSGVGIAARLRSGEIGEIVGGGLQEFSSAPDQIHRLLLLDSHLDLIIGELANLEGPEQKLVKSSIQLIGTGEDQSVLRYDLSMTR